MNNIPKSSPVKFCLRKISVCLLASCALMTTSAEAALITQNVIGSLSKWQAWDNLSKSIYGNDYYRASIGHDLTNTDQYGRAVLNQYLRPFALSVQGTISYDDSNGIITALDLYQVGSFTAGFNYQGYNSGTTTIDVLTFEDFAWSLSGNNLQQVSGSATGCHPEYGERYCQGIRDGINANTHTNNLGGQSIFDFQGINAGFQTLPRSNSNDTDYGTAHNKIWSATAGISAVTANNYANTLEFKVASRINSGAASINYANIATFSLQSVSTLEGGFFEPTPVPVPAAAWFMTSGLLALGLLRKK